MKGPESAAFVSSSEDSDDSESTIEEHERDGKLASWKSVVVMCLSAAILIFFLFVDIDPQKPKVSRGAAVLLIMALWWISEVVPLAVTSFLPMVLYPLLGVIKAKELAGKFFNGTSFLFCAGFLLGLALERWGMHKRIAFNIVAKMGCRIELLLAGFMLSVWLLSMWISNTAAMLSMLPVAEAFLVSLPPGNEGIKKGFLLAVGYSATLGGIATPVGTPTNGIFLGLFQTFWPEVDPLPQQNLTATTPAPHMGFSFALFVGCALPLSVMLIFVLWLGICAWYVWRSPQRLEVNQQMFRDQAAALGKLSYEEMVVSVDLMLLIILWFTKSKLGSFAGWATSVTAKGYIGSGSIGLAMTLILFFIPCGARLPKGLRRFVGTDRCKSTSAPTPNPRYILDWDAIREGFKWEILFVFGGGYLVACGTVTSGLADALAGFFGQLNLSEGVLLVMVCTITTFVTEVVSNMASVAIFGPILVKLAQVKGYNPILFLLVVTLASSFAFMLPMAGGPNMIVYSTRQVSIGDMAKHGLGMNIVAIILGSCYFYWYLPLLVDGYQDLPKIVD